MSATMKINQKPFHLLLLFAFLLFIISLFSKHEIVIIQLNQTFFELTSKHLIWLPTILLFTFWLIYITTNHYLYSKLLIWIHIVLVILNALLIMVLSYFPAHHAIPKFQYPQNNSGIILSSFLFLVAWSAIYLVNLFIGLHKGINRP